MSLLYQETAVKPLTKFGKVCTIREIRAIVCADWREAQRHGDTAEEARCKAEMDLLSAQIDELTDGRGY